MPVRHSRLHAAACQPSGRVFLTPLIVPVRTPQATSKSLRVGRSGRMTFSNPGELTPREVRDRGEQFCVGTPAECIRFIELYEALGIEEMILLCAVGPASHEEVLNTMRLFGEQVIP